MEAPPVNVCINEFACTVASDFLVSLPSHLIVFVNDREVLRPGPLLNEGDAVQVWQRLSEADHPPKKGSPSRYKDDSTWTYESGFSTPRARLRKENDFARPQKKYSLIPFDVSDYLTKKEDVSMDNLIHGISHLQFHGLKSKRGRMEKNLWYEVEAQLRSLHIFLKNPFTTSKINDLVCSSERKNGYGALQFWKTSSPLVWDDNSILLLLCGYSPPENPRWCVDHGLSPFFFTTRSRSECWTSVVTETHQDSRHRHDLKRNLKVIVFPCAEYSQINRALVVALSYSRVFIGFLGVQDERRAYHALFSCFHSPRILTMSETSLVTFVNLTDADRVRDISEGRDNLEGGSCSIQ